MLEVKSCSSFTNAASASEGSDMMLQILELTNPSFIYYFPSHKQIHL